MNKQVMLRLFWLITALAMSAGCATTQGHYLPLQDKQRKDAVQMLLDNNAKRQELHGSVTVNKTGIEALFGQVDLNLIAQAPTQLYVSLPSFFGQPARVLSCDGQTLYILDMTEGEPYYAQRPCDQGNVAALLQLPLSAPELVEVLLGRFDPAHVELEDLKYDEQRQEYQLIEATGGLKSELYFDRRGNMVERRRLDGAQALIYEVHYQALVDKAGVGFASQWRLKVRSGGSDQEVQIMAKSLSYNERSFAQTDFVISPPWSKP